MKKILWGARGTSLNLSFLDDIDFVVDDEWQRLPLLQKIKLEIYWRYILRKFFKRVCYPISYLSVCNPSEDVIFLGNIFRREDIMPIANGLGFQLDVNLYEAFDLSPALCKKRRESVTEKEINAKDYEDDYRKLCMMADMIPEDVQSLCDVGCGERKLLKLINSNVKYVGIDYLRKAENILNIDLNKTDIPNIDADCFFCCGILEFIDDPLKMLAQISLRSPKYIILSYSPREYSNISTRRSRVYHNCIYSSQIASTICSHGYELNHFKRFESRQALYVFSKL